MVATYSRDDLRAGRADWIANPSARTSPESQWMNVVLAAGFFPSRAGCLAVRGGSAERVLKALNERAGL